MWPIDDDATFDLFEVIHCTGYNKMNFVYDMSVDTEFCNESMEELLMKK